MSGYLWSPRVRIVPTDGSAVTLWLPDVMPDARGPNYAQVRYLRQAGRGESVNRRLNYPIYGFRPDVQLEFDLFDMTEQHQLVKIANAAARDDAKLMLSMDGGLVEREVKLKDFQGPIPHAKKTFVGAHFELAFECCDLLTEIPEMMTDPGVGRELLPDGGMEQWTSATNLQVWGEGVATTGSWNQESTQKRSGSFSARGTKTIAETIFLSSAGTIPLLPGLWYRWDGYVRSDATESNIFRLLLQNLKNLKYLAPDAQTWQLAGVYALQSGGNAAGWTRATIDFRVDIGALDTDTYRAIIDFGAANAVGSNVYWDDFSLFGPILRSGYATW